MRVKLAQTQATLEWTEAVQGRRSKTGSDPYISRSVLFRGDQEYLPPDKGGKY